MKHPATRELFDYWNARRGHRAAPERGEIEPGAIRRVLADTFILSFDEHGGHPFRIAGTRVCALFGRELKGEAFARLWEQNSAKLVHDLVACVARDTVGVVAGASGASANNEALDLEFLALPLSHHGRTDSRVIGVLAPLAAPDRPGIHAPYWLGVHALGKLTFGSFRFIGGAAPRPVSPRPAPLPSSGRIKHGLVVYDGGQA